MKILCVIDSLGSGGAQRQMVNLACGLKEKGHDVQVFIYFPELNFFKRQLEASGINLIEVQKGVGFSFKVLITLIRLMQSRTYHSVISFLDSPNIYVEIASIFTSKRPTLIVSERSSYTRSSLKTSGARRLLHFFADRVVANSVSHGRWLKKHWWMTDKTCVIYNGYNIPRRENNLPVPTRPAHQKKFLVVGRVDHGKNGIRLVEALILFWWKHGYAISVSWVGLQEMTSESLVVRKEMDELLKKNREVAKQWEWLGQRDDVDVLLAGCDALIHVSLFEGLPNVVCEAFIAGRSVILSNVCDHPILVGEEERGLLCDPKSPESICGAIERFLALPDRSHEEMANNARIYAEKYLTVDRMVKEFEELF